MSDVRHNWSLFPGACLQRYLRARYVQWNLLLKRINRIVRAMPISPRCAYIVVVSTAKIAVSVTLPSNLRDNLYISYLSCAKPISLIDKFETMPSRPVQCCNQPLLLDHDLIMKVCHSSYSDRFMLCDSVISISRSFSIKIASVSTSISASSSL